MDIGRSSIPIRPSRFAELGDPHLDSHVTQVVGPLLWSRSSRIRRLPVGHEWRLRDPSQLNGETLCCLTI
jgi:hypothetical protein